MKISVVLLALALLGVSPAPLASIDASAIRTISIDITLGALGPGAKYRATFERRNATFFTDAKYYNFITQDEVETLVYALQQPPAEHFDLSRSLITPEVSASISSTPRSTRFLVRIDTTQRQNDYTGMPS